jgi:hypothetical protein
LRFANQGTDLPRSGATSGNERAHDLVRADGVVELAVSRAVQEAFPLVPVEYEYSLLRIAGHAHEDPLGPIRGYGAEGREGDLDRSVAATRTMPGLPGGVDTEFGDRGLGGHGFLATPQ